MGLALYMILKFDLENNFDKVGQAKSLASISVRHTTARLKISVGLGGLFTRTVHQIMGVIVSMVVLLILVINGSTTGLFYKGW